MSLDAIETQTKRLLKVYRQAEAEIEKEMQRLVMMSEKTGKDYEQLKGLANMQKNIKSILNDLAQVNAQWTEEAVTQIYSNAVYEARAELYGIEAVMSGGFDAVHQHAAQILAETVHSRLADVITTIGRKTRDIFRVVQLDASLVGSSLGYETWKQTRDKILANLKRSGITGFVDRLGRQWNMNTYSEMLARTALMDVHLEGKKREFIGLREDLVIVSSHPGACELCKPYEGKILSLSGATPGYASLDEAEDHGLFHPNCRHNFELWIPDE
ncbi:phage minor capsid protein [Aminobacterium colombiense]